MDEEGIFKGGTLIINLDSIEMIGSDYVFVEGDKIRIALKKYKDSEDNVLYGEITPTVGESTAQYIFSREETQEKLELGKKYILQADLINQEKTFPMLLQELKVIGQAIIPSEEWVSVCRMLIMFLVVLRQ